MYLFLSQTAENLVLNTEGQINKEGRRKRGRDEKREERKKSKKEKKGGKTENLFEIYVNLF